MRRLLERDGGGSAKAALIVTHTGHILREVPADHGHVLVRGQIVCRGEPRTLFDDIRVPRLRGVPDVPALPRGTDGPRRAAPRRRERR